MKRLWAVWLTKMQNGDTPATVMFMGAGFTLIGSIFNSWGLAHGGMTVLMLGALWGAVRMFTQKMKEREEREQKRQAAERIKDLRDLQTKYQRLITEPTEKTTAQPEREGGA